MFQFVIIDLTQILISAAAKRLSRSADSDVENAALQVAEEEGLGPSAVGAGIDRRGTTRQLEREREDRLEKTPPLVGAALVLDPGAVFADARRRVALIFKLTVAITTILAILLLVGVGGAIAGGLLGHNVWATVAGGVSVLDVLTVVVYKPLTQLNNAIVSAQRLDLLFLSTNERLKDCRSYEDVKEQIRCSTRVWKDMRQELATLASTS